MKKTRIIFGLLLGAALLASNSGIAMAAEDTETVPETTAVESEQLYQGVVGTVSADSDIAGGTVVIETKSLGTVEVLLNENTIYKAPGQDEASINDIETGDRLAILATVSEETVYTAVRVMMVPAVATRQHISGVVVSVENKVMTVMNAAGETMTIELPDGVKGGVVGEFISTAVRKSSGGKNPEATGIQTAAEVHARLQNHFNAVAGQDAATQAQVQTREQAMAKLGEKMEGLGLRNKGELERVMAKAPESAKAGIQTALGNCEQRMEQARRAVQNIQGASGGSQQSGPNGQSSNTSGSTANGSQGGSQHGR